MTKGVFFIEKNKEMRKRVNTVLLDWIHGLNTSLGIYLNHKFHDFLEFSICYFFPPKLTLSLTLWHRLPPQCFLLLSQGKKKERKKKSVCFALKIDLWLVLFHSICRTLSLSSERWRAVHLLCLLCWVGGGWGCNSPDFRACKALPFVYFGSFSVLHLSTLSSLSIFLQHNGAGVVKLLQARNQI